MRKKTEKTSNKPIIIRPQQGKQEMFLRSPADICIYGGAAGGGKTYALLLECLRHIDNKLFEAVIFRQSRPQIMSAGGLYATSQEIYPHLGASSVLTPNVQWRFQSGAKVTFAHMFYEKEKYNWQGSQIPLLMFDELVHFTESQFFYMFSRNRSTCGVRPYIRATPTAKAGWLGSSTGGSTRKQGTPMKADAESCATSSAGTTSSIGLTHRNSCMRSFIYTAQRKWRK